MSNHQLLWIGPEDPPDGFPPVSGALIEPDGLLAAGGDLSVARLLWAYRHGIFPWSEDGQPMLWWSPDPRCVFRPGEFHASRRLRRAIRKSDAEIRINTQFANVIRACAAPRRYECGTWITAEMIEAYEALHSAGWAHSVEVWQTGELVGGLYGLAIGRAFFGESMFSKHTDASKIALLYLSNLLEDGSFDILDCQVRSQHLLSLGASLIPRDEFVQTLDSACDPEKPLEFWPNAPITAARMLHD